MGSSARGRLFGLMLALAVAATVACGEGGGGGTPGQTCGQPNTPPCPPPITFQTVCCQDVSGVNGDKLLEYARNQRFLTRRSVAGCTDATKDPQACEISDFSVTTAGTSEWRCRDLNVPYEEPTTTWEPTGNTKLGYVCSSLEQSIQEEMRKRPVSDPTEKYCCEGHAILSRANRETFITSRSQGVGCVEPGALPAVCNYTNFSQRPSGTVVWRCVDLAVPQTLPSQWERTSTPLRETAACGINGQLGAEEEMRKK